MRGACLSKSPGNVHCLNFNAEKEILVDALSSNGSLVKHKLVLEQGRHLSAKWRTRILSLVQALPEVLSCLQRLVDKPWILACKALKLKTQSLCWSKVAVLVHVTC